MNNLDANANRGAENPEDVPAQQNVYDEVVEPEQNPAGGAEAGGVPEPAEQPQGAGQGGQNVYALLNDGRDGAAGNEAAGNAAVGVAPGQNREPLYAQPDLSLKSQKRASRQRAQGATPAAQAGHAGPGDAARAAAIPGFPLVSPEEDKEAPRYETSESWGSSSFQ